MKIVYRNIEFTRGERRRYDVRETATTGRLGPNSRVNRPREPIRQLRAPVEMARISAAAHDRFYPGDSIAGVSAVAAYSVKSRRASRYPRWAGGHSNECEQNYHIPKHGCRRTTLAPYHLVSIRRERLDCIAAVGSAVASSALGSRRFQQRSCPLGIAYLPHARP